MAHAKASCVRLRDTHVSKSYYHAVAFARCPDLHTMVLFLASLEHTKFLELFLRQGHGKLASLQVLFYTGSRRKEQYSQFWTALLPAQSLQKLQLVISATQAEPVKEVTRHAALPMDSDIITLCNLSSLYHSRSFITSQMREDLKTQYQLGMCIAHPLSSRLQVCML